MLFRKAETCEAEAISALYQAVIGTPFCTWDESYPGETEIAGDLSAGTLYVLEVDHQTAWMRSKCILPAHFRRSPADV